jgi:serine/threonine protein kinase
LQRHLLVLNHLSSTKITIRQQADDESDRSGFRCTASAGRQLERDDQPSLAQARIFKLLTYSLPLHIFMATSNDRRQQKWWSAEVALAFLFLFCVYAIPAVQRYYRLFRVRQRRRQTAAPVRANGEPRDRSIEQSQHRDRVDQTLSQPLSSTARFGTILIKGGHENVASIDMLPFRHLSMLGIGGSAVVDLVADKNHDGQLYAHKRFRLTSNHANRIETDFKNEIDIMKRLHLHPHIVRVHWSYTCGRQLGMLLTPVASDKDLRAYLEEIRESGKPLQPEQSLTLTRAFGCLASGLAYIHSLTIRHKDIKPQNILVHNGRMIYTDFGISVDANGQNTTTTGPSGPCTQRYCAPEVANNEPRNRKSDLFSLGCVYVEILEVLTGNASLIGADTELPYWMQAEEIQNRLMRLGTSDLRFNHLFAICSCMMESESTCRIDAEELVRRVRYIRESDSGVARDMYCMDCEGPSRKNRPKPRIWCSDRLNQIDFPLENVIGKRTSLVRKVKDIRVDRP